MELSSFPSQSLFRFYLPSEFLDPTIIIIGKDIVQYVPTICLLFIYLFFLIFIYEYTVHLPIIP